MTSTQRVAVVTGSSSGNGYETSLKLARNGFLTYATMRSLHKGEDIKSLAEKEKLPLKTVWDEGTYLFFLRMFSYCHSSVFYEHIVNLPYCELYLSYM
jgi:NAD(P)-dependent dehydrogenase (short-subunit alcohol dehydrogenase family)